MNYPFKWARTFTGAPLKRWWHLHLYSKLCARFKVSFLYSSSSAGFPWMTQLTGFDYVAAEILELFRHCEWTKPVIKTSPTLITPPHTSHPLAVALILSSSRSPLQFYLAHSALWFCPFNIHSPAVSSAPTLIWGTFVINFSIQECSETVQNLENSISMDNKNRSNVFCSLPRHPTWQIVFQTACCGFLRKSAQLIKTSTGIQN